MKTSTVITIAALAAAVAGAILLRRKFAPKQEEPRLVQVNAANATATTASPKKITNPVKAAAHAPLIAQKPKHPAKMIQEAKWGNWGSITGTNELSAWI